MCIQRVSYEGILVKIILLAFALCSIAGSSFATQQLKSSHFQIKRPPPYSCFFSNNVLQCVRTQE